VDVKVSHIGAALSIEQRCRVHADKMQGEGWYVTANVLAEAAETIKRLRARTMTIIYAKSAGGYHFVLFDCEAADAWVDLVVPTGTECVWIVPGTINPG
jgi:hypothetical protein